MPLKMIKDLKTSFQMVQLILNCLKSKHANQFSFLQWSKFLHYRQKSYSQRFLDLIYNIVKIKRALFNLKYLANLRKSVTRWIRVEARPQMTNRNKRQRIRIRLCKPELITILTIWMRPTKTTLTKISCLTLQNSSSKQSQIRKNHLRPLKLLTWTQQAALTLKKPANLNHRVTNNQTI